MLNVNGLSSVTQLSKGDRVLVVTNDGIQELDAEVLWKVLSNTSLFETYNLVELSELNVQTLTTHNKIQKYLNEDTSDEIYLEYSDNTVKFIRGRVLLNSDGIPLISQAQAISGELLYWSQNITDAVMFKGFPWKSQDDEKIFITTEKTDYPVSIYQYELSLLKESEIEIVDNEPVITDIFSSSVTSQGVVKKQKNEFLFYLQENSDKQCGIKMSVNEDGTITGKLIGTWDGLNDWDVDQALTTGKFKNWFYNNQDYYTYIKTLSLETSNKVGWYLNKDTNIHVFTRIENSQIIVIQAKNKTNSAGSYIKEQAVNNLGNKLYWNQEMDYQVGTSGNGIPLKSGKYVFMTTEETDHPVWIYQYVETELLRFDYGVLPDNSNGIRQIFSDGSGTTTVISKTNTEFNIEFKKNNKTVAKINLKETGGQLTGTWKVGDKELNTNELPEQSNSTKDKILKSNGQTCSWETESKELPNHSANTKGKVLTSNGQTCSWEGIPTELPAQSNDVKNYILSTDGKNVSWVDATIYLQEIQATIKNLTEEVNKLKGNSSIS
jgi:hypothetical protein